jgi:hypothetical protein
MIFALALLLASGGSSQWTISPDQLPLPLRPLPEARHVVAAGAAGEFAVHYDLQACYPASATLDLLLKRLPAEWVPRKENFLNPGMPTSHVRGWTHYEDDRTQPHSYVNHWAGEWDDTSGRILTYDLVFRSRTENETSCNLEISATQLSAATVRALESSARGRSGPVAAVVPRRTNAIRIVNPDFIVLRPLQNQPTTHTAAASIYGKRLYFDPSDRILDLRQLVPETATIHGGPEGTFVIIIDTTAEGAKALNAWTSTHLNQQLGVFVDNRLIDAPVIRSAIDGGIAISGRFTKPQAEEVKRRLLRGGAP